MQLSTLDLRARPPARQTKQVWKVVSVCLKCAATPPPTWHRLQFYFAWLGGRRGSLWSDRVDLVDIMPLTGLQLGAIVLPCAASFAGALLLLRWPAPTSVSLHADCNGRIPTLGLRHWLRAFLSPLKTLPLLGRPTVRARGKESFRIPDIRIVVRQVVASGLDAAAIDAAYESRATGTPLWSVPLFFFDVVSQALLIRIMTHPTFPFAVLGSVKSRVSLTQQRAIPSGAVVDVRARVGESRGHRRGTEVDMVVDVEDVATGDVVWSCTTTILFFHKSDSLYTYEPPALPDTSPDTDRPMLLAEDLGRRFAAVTGDYNPIHMHAWSARLFGFRSAIVSPIRPPAFMPRPRPCMCPIYLL